MPNGRLARLFVACALGCALGSRLPSAAKDCCRDQHYKVGLPRQSIPPLLVFDRLTSSYSGFLVDMMHEIGFETGASLA